MDGSGGTITGMNEFTKMMRLTECKFFEKIESDRFKVHFEISNFDREIQSVVRVGPYNEYPLYLNSFHLNLAPKLSERPAFKKCRVGPKGEDEDDGEDVIDHHRRQHDR